MRTIVHVATLAALPFLVGPAPVMPILVTPALAAPAAAPAAGVAAAPVAAIAPAAAPASPAAPAQAPKYTSADTEIGTLLDDPAARAILERAIPGMTGNDQIDMARSMTLKMIQPHAADQITDAKLHEIDAEFAKLK